MRPRPDPQARRDRSGPRSRGASAAIATHPHFVTCAPGLEPLLHAELKALKLARLERQVGGVYFEGTARDAMRVNLESRVAVRVLRRLTRFPAASEGALYDGVRAVDWEPYLRPGGTLLVAARTRDSALDHSLFVEQRVKDGVCDALREARGERPTVDRSDPDLRVDVHLFRDRCTLSVDTSGDSLHKRGWRVFQGGAPLAETLAAGLVLHSGWDRRAPLVDPFCGSGTLLVEAAHLAADRAPGLSRERFAFEGFADHEAAAWEGLRAAARERVRLPKKLQLIGSDSDPEVVAGARRNLEAAGLADAVRLEVARAEDFAPRRGWNAQVLTNPPYGERLGEAGELGATYRAFGERLREGCAGYGLALFSGNTELAAELGLDFEQRLPLLNGALECELLLDRL